MEPALPRRFTTGSVVRTPLVLPSSAIGRDYLGYLGSMCNLHMPFIRLRVEMLREKLKDEPI